MVTSSNARRRRGPCLPDRHGGGVCPRPIILSVVRRGAPGAAAVLRSTAAADDSVSYPALLDSVAGAAERHAIEWALRFTSTKVLQGAERIEQRLGSREKIVVTELPIYPAKRGR